MFAVKPDKPSPFLRSAPSVLCGGQSGHNAHEGPGEPEISHRSYGSRKAIVVMTTIGASASLAAPTPDERPATASKKEQACLDKIVAAYEAATSSDIETAAELVARATGSPRAVELRSLTPGTAAVLFLDHNKQNREWKYTVSEGYAEEIAAGQWEFTNQGVGFLVTGNVGDGQHRLGGIALSGQTMETTITYGMTVGSIIAIDTGHRRQASDFLDIEKASDTKRKQSIIKQAYGLIRRVSAEDEETARMFMLGGNRDVYNAIKTHTPLLVEAMEIGDDSVRGRSKPTFKANDAAALAFILMLHNWPKAKVISDLDVFQSGEDREGAASPLFVAADQLQKSAQKREGATASSRYAAAIKAFYLHEKGVKAVRVAEIRSAMKALTEVDLSYPGTGATRSA